MSSLTFGKVFYLARQTQRRLLSGNSGCPNCGSRRFVKMDAKAILIELRECQDCRLFYRFPTDSVEDNRAFYQKAYKQGVTTDLPDAATLARLKETGFTGHEKSYAGLIELLERLGVKRGARVFDYGCSWGFGSWQFSQAGYSVSAFEISVHRAAYGRMNLDIDCIDSLDQIESRTDLERSFDAFFSNHVIEHVPSPAKVIGLARHLAKPGGLFIAVTPNGSLDFRGVAPRSWHQLWGKVHPNLISDTFWATAFRDCDHFIGALPSAVSSVEAWAAGGGKIRTEQRDPELLCVARL